MNDRTAALDHALGPVLKNNNNNIIIAKKIFIYDIT